MCVRSRRWRARAGEGNKDKRTQSHARGGEKNADVIALENASPMPRPGRDIDDRARGGTLTIRYRNHDQLDDLVQRLVRGQ